MAEVKDITGSGFFSASGELKTKEQLASETKSTDKSNSNQSAASSTDAASTDFSGQVGDAFGKVQSQFIEKANDIINVIHTDEQNVNKAEKVVKEQINVAKDLKAAIKDGDTQKADKLREKLSKLTEKRDALAGDIQKDNADAVGKRVKNLNVGNEQKGIIVTKEVKFSKTEDADLSSAKGVNSFIQSLKDDKAQLDTQKKEIGDKKQKVKDVISATKTQLSSLKKNVLDNYQQASAATSKIATQISQGGQAFLAHNINESVASALLSA